MPRPTSLSSGQRKRILWGINSDGNGIIQIVTLPKIPSLQIPLTFDSQVAPHKSFRNLGRVQNVKK